MEDQANKLKKKHKVAPELARLRAKVASAASRGNREQETQYRADLKTAVLEKHIRETLASAPLPTADQRKNLASLLVGKYSAKRQTASTRTHDFYAGRGPGATYLGTAVLRDDVGEMADRLMAPHRLWREGNVEQKFTAEVWTKRVNNLLASTEDVSPESVSHQWPHPHHNSLDTDYSWWFESGGLYLYNLGALVEIRYPNGGIKSKLRFPDFTRPTAYTEENAR